MVDQRIYYVGFSLVKGIGSVRVRMLQDYFGNLETAWNAPVEALQRAGLGEKIIKTLQHVRATYDLEVIWEDIQTKKIHVITWEDGGYPNRLRELEQPPPVLYYRGNFTLEDDWAVGIVGTRRMTVYGKQVADEIARNLATQGVTIVSGLARGVDAVAHQAALEAGGRTIAVLGSGVDEIYPPEHERLAARIIDQGAILSDYAPGTPPDSANFPPRNRIISALARAVIVVEASESSGALITAAFAAEQGREVFAVPGQIHAPQSQGTNRLIQQGARLLLNPQDVLEVLNMTQLPEQAHIRQVIPADPTEALIYSRLSHEPQHIDEIRRNSDLPIEQVSATLAIMELKGMVKQVGGMQYICVREEPENYA
jgi:DNA processing protein